MKKVIFYFLVLLCFNGFAQIKNVAVSPFEMSGVVLDAGEVEAITELYASELADTGRVHILNHLSFVQIAKELNFRSEDFFDSNKLSLLGERAKVDALSYGKIMRVGKTFYLSASLVDVSSAKVLSSAKLTLATLDNIDTSLKKLVRELVQGLVIKVGDIGPAGGIVFYIEGEVAFECSKRLGECDWAKAKTMCANYKGGDEEDWRLPTKNELDLIYKNLRDLRKIEEDGLYWSSTENDIYDAWAKNFATGEQIAVELINKLGVRAVRAFSLSAF